jgi:hypothetical protein
MSDPLSTVMAKDALDLQKPIGTALQRIELVAIDSNLFSIFIALSTAVIGATCSNWLT